MTISKTDVTCFGRNDGTMTANVTGGTAPFTYNWSTTMQTATVTNLIPGTYSVTVSDGNQCTARATASVVEPSRFLYTITPNQGICHGSEASISVNATGGTTPYTYIWNDGLTAVSNRIVSPEETTSYTVTVTDANGCSQTSTTFVDQPEAIYVTNPIPNGGTICIGETFHSYANATGGLGPYEFVWTGPNGFVWYGHNFTASPTESETYTLNVTDVNGCTVAK